MINRTSPLDEATARYLVVCQVCAEIVIGMSRTEAVEEVAGRVHPDKVGRLRRVGIRTVWRWLKRWEEDGIEGLRDVPRARSASTLPMIFLEHLKEQKRLEPEVSVPEIIRRARALGVIAEEDIIDRTTVWRECRRQGLSTLRRASDKRDRQRPWRFRHRMEGRCHV